jgi:hypothetical protein
MSRVFACSIDLYAINIMSEVVPGKYAQTSKSIQDRRRFTPDKAARDDFGRSLIIKPDQAVSSHLMEQSHILGGCCLAGVTY